MTVPESDHSFNRVSSPGGTFGNVNACVTAYTYAVSGTTAFEWNSVAILDNHASEGENCAGYFQANTFAGGPTWAICADARAVSGYGPLIGAEVSIAATGPDPARVRRGVHVAFNPPGQPLVDSEAAAGVHVSAGDGRRWISGVEAKDCRDACYLAIGSGTARAYDLTGEFVIGFDFSRAKFAAGTVIRLKRDQVIAFEETDSVTVGLHGGRVEVRLLGEPVMALDYGTGDLYLKGEVKRL